MTAQDMLQRFANLAKVSVIADDGGDYIEFEFTNGARVRVCPDHDSVWYAKPGEENEATVGMMVDLAGGAHAEGEPPLFWSNMDSNTIVNG